MLEIESHIVPQGQPAIRLLDFCIQNFNLITTRSGIKKAIKKGEVWLDGELAEGGIWLKIGQRVVLCEGKPSTHKIFELKLDIVFEDDDIAVIYKPAGYEVSGNKFKTIQNALSFNLKTSLRKDHLSRAVPVHRLDYPTSGLLICAKTHRAAVEMGRQFEEKTIKKTYLAIVNGKLEEIGKLENQLDGKNAITFFESLKTIPSLKAGFISLLKLNPQTGRTHQLRRHLAQINHPIVGDGLYNTNYPLLKGKGVFLSAVSLVFKHPFTDEIIELNSQIPEKFTSLLTREKVRFEKLGKR